MRQTVRPPAHAAGLRTGHLVGLLIATHTPVTVLWAFVPIAFSARVVATPLIFALSGLLLLCFVLGYSGLGRRIRHPGGLYVQVVRGLGRPVGLGAATVLFVAYTGVVTGVYGLSARTLKDLLAATLGVDLPASVAVVVVVVVVVAVSTMPLLTTARILSVVVGIQIVTILWFAYAALNTPASGEVSFAALDPGWLLSGSFGVALVMAVTAFVGSEGSAAYSDELADPQRSIPRATFVSYAVTTVLLMLSSWAISVIVGPEEAAIPGVVNLPDVLANLAGPDMASAVLHTMMLNLLVGLVATGVTLNNTASRLLTGLARDGVLPSAFAAKRTGAPPSGAATLVQPLAAGAVAFAFTFTTSGAVSLWVTIACGLSVVGVLMLASAATTAWFIRGEADESGFFGWEGQVIAGLLSAATTGSVFCYGVTRMREVAPGAPEAAAWLVGTLIGAVFAVGVIAALILRASRPRIYARIGGGSAELDYRRS